MPHIFRNQIVISRNEIGFRLPGFYRIRWNAFYVYIDRDVPIVQSGTIFLIGRAWNSASGLQIGIDDLTKISNNTVVDEIQDFSGRFLLLVGNKIIPDCTSSYSVYYTSMLVCTNFSLLCSLMNIQWEAKPEYRNKVVLPPCTLVPGIKRLIPGQYFDMEYYKPISIVNLLDDMGIHETEKRLLEAIEYLKKNAKGIRAVTGDDYRLMLTGGKDSRLSLLSMHKAIGLPLKTMTHVKPLFCNDPNDIRIPRKLMKLMGLSHSFIKSGKVDFTTAKEVSVHSADLAMEQEPGSTYFYYKYGSWKQIKESFLIDNYYEIGRRHLLGKGLISSARTITFDTIINSGLLIDRSSFTELYDHLRIISGRVDLLDAFYYIKNYTNVGNQFGMIDYSHNPLIFCNSQNLFRQLLGVPEEDRENGKFHLMLLKMLSSKKEFQIACNKNSNTVAFRTLRKIREHWMKLRFSKL